MSTLKKERPKFEHIIFLDRTHGKKMATLLRKVGLPVRSIYQVYPKKKHESVSDPTWIALCAKKGWIGITGDKRIEKNVINRTAVVEHKARIFVLTDTNSMPEEWAAAVIVGQGKIATVSSKNPGPFFSTIQRQSRGHVSDARFPDRTEVADEPKEGIKQTENSAELRADDSSGTGNEAGGEENPKEKS